MKTPKRFCKCGCKHVLPAGREDAEFVDATHRKRWERAKYKEADPEVAANVKEVAQLTKAGKLPDEYLTAIRDLQELRRDALDIPDMCTTLIDGISDLALHHGSAEAVTALNASLNYEVAGLFFSNLVSFAERLRAYAQSGVEAYAEGHLGDSMNELLYPAQVGHYWQAGDDPEDDEEGLEL